MTLLNVKLIEQEKKERRVPVSGRGPKGDDSPKFPEGKGPTMGAPEGTAGLGGALFGLDVNAADSGGKGQVG